MTESAFHLNGPLVVRSPNWLGDAVMALPAVRNLKTLVKGPLTVAAPEKLAALWHACPFVDHVIALEKPKNLRASAGQLRAGKFKSAVLLPNSLRSAAEVWLAGIPQRAGYARGGRALLLTRAIPVPSRNPARLHQSLYYIDLVTALGGPSDTSMPSIESKIDSIKNDLFVVTMCPGAEYGPAKRWPVENFAAMANYALTQWQAKIMLLGAPGDVPVAEDLTRQISEKGLVENRTGKTTLAEFMTALASSHLVICNDSGSMHVAAALGVPTVAVFGSTEPQLTRPMGPYVKVLRHHVPCSPCFLRECPLDFACMKGVTPEMAIAAAEAFWK